MRSVALGGAWLVLVLGCANSVTGTHSDAGRDPLGVDRPPTIDAPTAEAPPVDRLPELPAYAAENYCAALFRCCDAPSREWMHLEILWNPGVVPEALQRRLGTMDAAQCPAVMTEIFRDWIFRDWFAAAEHGEVTYVPEEAARCAEALRAYRCDGDPWGSVGDNSCFRPSSGGRGRRMFRPVATPGHSCRLPRDPTTATYVGTCVPEQGHCCVFDPDDPTRCLDYTRVTDRSRLLEGTCVGVAALGATCGGPATRDNAARACAPPGRCGRASLRCIDQRPVPLGEGEPCFDRAEMLSLGVCTAPLRCDVSERDGRPPTDRCVRLRAPGQPCQAPGECDAYRCVDGVCMAAVRYCAGP